MNESLLSSDPGTQKRRSTRIVQAVPLTVTGVDALGQSFKERTTTTMVNCHGCKYQSKHYVPKNSIITLEIPRPEPAFPPRIVLGRVVWVQRPRTVRELFQIGLEFEVPGNVWGIAFPPEDWFPPPNEPVATQSAPAKAATPAEPKLSIAPAAAEEASIDLSELLSEQLSGETAATTPAASAPPAIRKTDTPPAAVTIPTFSIPAPPPMTPAGKPRAAAPAQPAAETKIPAARPAETPADSQALARQMAQMVAEAKASLDKSLRRGAEEAITEEMTVVRQQLDVQLHETVEKAIKVSMERVSESAVKKVVQQAADRTASIVEEARKASEVTTEQLDLRVRRAVEEAVTHAAEQAAQQAAQQTAAQNLSHAVEEAVERAISGREASTPSLEILSSPEAAQNHLNAWRKNLEESAQEVRSRTIEQTQAEALAAQQRWQEEFQAALSGASQSLVEKLRETSQTSLSQAEAEIESRRSGIRSSLDEAIAAAKQTIESLGSGLTEERARAEGLKSQLRDDANSSVEHARRRMAEISESEYHEIGRKADQIIEDRAQQLAPRLEASARAAAEKVTAEIDQKLAPKLDEVQKAVAEITRTEQQTSQLQVHIRAQMQQASDQVAQLEAEVRAQAQRAAEHATNLQDAVREQVQQISQQAIAESLGLLRQETAKIPAEVEESCRAVVAKAEEELQQRTTEAQHETYEALLKAADWYQKKAQTTMQTSLERSVEQSTTTLRDCAAEISSMVASELDHYRRTYVEHSAAQIEDAAKEVVVREREKLTETAETAAAGFTDRVERVTGDSLRRFEDVSRTALEKARSDMEYDREGSLAEFQKKLEERVMESANQARVHLQSQLIPLMEAWEERREAQQRAWIEQLKKSTDESIEQYKGRLENASNSWLLASATTLGQHSQAVLDTLAKSAEKRMRETVSGVLAGMGDTLKDRLLGISSDLDTEDDSGAAPPRTKK